MASRNYLIGWLNISIMVMIRSGGNFKARESQNHTDHILNHLPTYLPGVGMNHNSYLRGWITRLMDAQLIRFHAPNRMLRSLSWWMSVSSCWPRKRNVSSSMVDILIGPWLGQRASIMYLMKTLVVITANCVLARQLGVMPDNVNSLTGLISSLPSPRPGRGKQVCRLQHDTTPAEEPSETQAGR